MWHSFCMAYGKAFGLLPSAVIPICLIMAIWQNHPPNWAIWAAGLVTVPFVCTMDRFFNKEETVLYHARMFWDECLALFKPKDRWDLDGVRKL
jgi:hypothetical protein